MTEKKPIYYLTPVLLAVLIVASNFLNLDLFKAGLPSFTVWFVLSLFSFVCGWLIDKTLGWVHGGKIVFSVTVASTVISLFLVSFFSKFFGMTDAVVENLILYSLRTIMLGAMGFFGMALAEVMLLQQRRPASAVVPEIKEGELRLKEAELEAQKILADAKGKSSEMIERGKAVERELRELLRAEMELIRKYENNK